MKNQLPVCTDNIVHEAFQAEAEAETEVLTHETEVSASWSEARLRHSMPEVRPIKRNIGVPQSCLEWVVLRPRPHPWTIFGGNKCSHCVFVSCRKKVSKVIAWKLQSTHEPWFVHHGVLLQSSVVEGGRCWQLANKGMCIGCQACCTGPQDQGKTEVSKPKKKHCKFWLKQDWGIRAPPGGHETKVLSPRPNLCNNITYPTSKMNKWNFHIDTFQINSVLSNTFW